MQFKIHLNLFYFDIALKKTKFPEYDSTIIFLDWCEKEIKAL